MAVNYDDDRFKQVNAEKEQALNKVNDTYNGMITDSNKYYQQLQDNVNQWGETQKQLQQEQTDFAIEKINQQKEWAKKDYEKEQRGAYTDYQKTTNQYGVLSENMANQGMSNTGYAETTLRGVYNTYQNRISTARESFNRAIVDYDNGIKEAMLSNNSKLAEISYNTLKEALTYSLQGFQYKNDLLEKQLQMVNTTEDRYYTRWKDVLNQINVENELEEQKRQFNEQMALQRAQLYASSRGGGGSGGGGGSIDFGDTSSNSNEPDIYGLKGQFTGNYVNVYDKKGNLIDKAKIYMTDDGKMNERWYFDGTTGTWKPYTGSTGGSKTAKKK